MIKTGDRVKFLSETGSGIVRSVKGAVATVEMEDGFEVPVMITDLVAVNEEEELEAVRKIGVGDERPGKKGKTRPGDPQQKKERPLRSEFRFGKVMLTDDGEEEDIVDMEQIRRQYIQQAAALNKKEIETEARKATEKDYFPEEIPTPAQMDALKEEPEQMPVSGLKKTEPGKPVVEEQADDPEKAVPKTSEPEVVDLHAGEILNSTKNMSAGEILDAQLARFTLALDLALNSKRKGRMVFIHGKGSGKLKYEIKKLLAKKYPKLHHQDASFREYGYGAIMVILS